MRLFLHGAIFVDVLSQRKRVCLDGSVEFGKEQEARF